MSDETRNPAARDFEFELAEARAKLDDCHGYILGCEKLIEGTGLLAVKIKRLKAERDALVKVLERLYPYIESVNHMHLGGNVLYASEIWDALAPYQKTERKP